MENYHELKNLEDKRLIVYNLAWLLAKQNRYDESKFYLLDLKNEMEQDKSYMEEYENKYCNLLMLYIEVDQDIPKEEYKKENGKFTYVVNGVNSLVYYKKVSLNETDEYVIISYIPNISTKKMCTVVSEWVFAVCFIVSAVLILSFRNSILKMNSEKSKKNNG